MIFGFGLLFLIIGSICAVIGGKDIDRWFKLTVSAVIGCGIVLMTASVCIAVSRLMP